MKIAVEFLSKSRISKDFLIEVASQLRKDEKKSQRPEEKKILSKLIEDIESGKKSQDHFVLQENEYNYLSQNKKSLWADYLIFRYKFKIYPILKQLTDFPNYLLIEPVSYCNLKCVMCFQSDPTFTKNPHMGRMDIKLFKKVVDEAVKGGCGAITLASRGEPTLHPEFGEILKYAKGKFLDFKVNTNAMLLNEEKSRQILENGVTELVFSVDSAEKEEYERHRRFGKFEQVVANIRQFHEIRRKNYPKSKCRTRVSGVKYSKDFDSEHFVKFWKQYVDNVACVTMENRWDSYNNKLLNKDSACDYLWERMYVWFDGTVNPCDYDYKSFLKVGNVLKDSIKNIWTGKEYTKLRENHMNGKRQNCFPCDRCEI